jgi:acyl-coenzyme A thioesterase PaaI-like protein
MTRHASRHTNREEASRTGGPSEGRHRKRRRSWKQRLQLRLVNLYPPFLGSAIRVRRTDPRTFEVRMKLHWWSSNYVGTHFGGSLYTMCDPFYMLLLIEALGPGYIVWDKRAEIRFLRPGRGTVRARFHIPEERVEEIRRRADSQERVEPTFTVEVVDGDGQAVARVEKLLHVRRKDARRQHGRPAGPPEVTPLR